MLQLSVVRNLFSCEQLDLVPTRRYQIFVDSFFDFISVLLAVEDLWDNSELENVCIWKGVGVTEVIQVTCFLSLLWRHSLVQNLNYKFKLAVTELFKFLTH